jgi:hypothetical protein
MQLVPLRVGAMDPSKPHSKPILLKELTKLWTLQSYERFGPGNTVGAA